ncbi:hypothetical protein [Polynucleobacter sp. MWH-Svant-W18]|uniref:hypothetical protein n=1 Tax=Polynucleobacter sp. MWH-Svant-W18 TaxID=1855909 RepID=UPI001BFE12C7|nr:hypothetical protein [Polynucleobacter sp. MWH-Svant-W18]QWD78601.1 hypothetical protein C2757_03395 [Polynucleobacter sp. MWH-Svant-W18]
MFSFFNLFSRSHPVFSFRMHDGGRDAAGFKGGAGDCVVRSIAIAANLPYLQVYEDLREANARYANERDNKLSRHLTRKGSSPRNGNHRNVFHDYILSHGFEWVPTMKVGAGCQVHLRPTELPTDTLIVKVSKHLTAVIDGVIYDTHNPSRGGNRCVYGYYIKKKSNLHDHT